MEVLGNALAAAVTAFLMAFVYNELYRFTSRRLLAPTVVGVVAGLVTAAISYAYMLSPCQPYPWCALQ